MTDTGDPARPLPAVPWPGPGLVADIGGTHVRFGLVPAPGAAVVEVATLPVAAYPGPADAAVAYLTPLAQRLGAQWRAPRVAAFAVATAVGGDAVAFTNSGWAFSRRAVRAALGLDELWLLNDFEALALSLPGLAPAQLRAVGAAGLPWPQRNAAIGAAGRAGGRGDLGPAGGGSGAALAVVGPGTGLGVAGLVPLAAGAGAEVTAPRWVPVPGEGGHATLAAGDDFEAAVLAAARAALAAQGAGAAAHVSAERLLSGLGLPLLHHAVAAVLGAPPSPQPLSAPQILAHGLDASDETCSRTLDTFCALLGGFAGNVALTLGARGGVYIGGGIVPRLGERFFASRFRERFEAKGRFCSYLAPVPTALILDTNTALAGAAAALAANAARSGGRDDGLKG